MSLEASVNNALSKEKEAKKKMNASNAKALTAMKQKTKRAIKEYEDDVKKYQEVSCVYFPYYISSKRPLGSGSL